MLKYNILNNSTQFCVLLEDRGVSAELIKHYHSTCDL